MVALSQAMKIKFTKFKTPTRRVSNFKFKFETPEQQKTYQITGLNFDLQPIPRLELYLYQAKLEISIAERGPFLYSHRGQIKVHIKFIWKQGES